MKAIRIDGQTPGGKRQKLSEQLPMNTPFSIQVFPIYACNLACKYCLHSVPLSERAFVADKSILAFDIYKKFVDDAKLFPKKLKMLRFAGTGEPLLHPQLPEMVAYAKKHEIADSVDIVTNGVLLNHSMALALIKAGVDRIRISLQGLDDSAYKYLKTENFFNNFYNNIKFLYEHKGNTKIYIKVIDSLLNYGDEKKFLSMFGDISDFIAVEHLTPAVDKINYDEISNNVDMSLTQNGVVVQDVKICPQPFYMMQLNPDGNIVPCCSMETAVVLGNVANENIVDIWNGERYRIFLKNQLSFNKEIYPVCKKCQQYKYALFDEDILDNDANMIKGRWMKND